MRDLAKRQVSEVNVRSLKLALNYGRSENSERPFSWHHSAAARLTDLVEAERREIPHFPPEMFYLILPLLIKTHTLGER